MRFLFKFSSKERGKADYFQTNVYDYCLYNSTRNMLLTTLILRFDCST